MQPNVVAKTMFGHVFLRMRCSQTICLRTILSTSCTHSRLNLSDAPPHDRTSNPPLETTTVLTPSCEPLGTPARLTSVARLIHSPPVWVDGTPSTALPSGAYKHDLQDALVQASCRSNTWEELAPPILGHHPFRSGVAAADASAANDAEDDDFLGLSAEELAAFVAELNDARATIYCCHSCSY